MKKSHKLSILIMLVVVGVLTGITYFYNLKKQVLPILSPNDVNPELVDVTVRKTGTHLIENFKLLDQENNEATHEFVDGKIYVADFFFTTCQSICPIMTGQMSRVAKEFETVDDIKFLSFTVLPDIDSPKVLNAYAIEKGIKYEQWRLLTGEKKVIYELARKNYFTLKETEVGQGDGGDSDFIHTNNLVLIDRKRQIRGYYDGTSLREVNKLIEDIKLLMRNG